eukprot:1618558-Prymnesium_polylepis.1
MHAQGTQKVGACVYDLTQAPERLRSFSARQSLVIRNATLQGTLSQATVISCMQARFEASFNMLIERPVVAISLLSQGR